MQPGFWLFPKGWVSDQIRVTYMHTLFAWVVGGAQIGAVFGRCSRYNLYSISSTVVQRMHYDWQVVGGLNSLNLNISNFETHPLGNSQNPATQ